MKKSKSPLRSMSRAVALEPRLLFDGAGAVAAADYVVDDQASAEQGQPQPVAEASAAHPVEGDAGAVALMDSSEGIEGVLPGSQTARLELDDEADEAMPALDATGSVLLVVDSRVADYQSLLDDLPANVQVRIVEGDESGLDAVTEALASGVSFDAIHIISHGTPGSLALGSDQLDASTLDAHGSTLQGWADYLSEGADILLYGCDLAQGDQGQAFIDELARLTGADIAASTNATGSAAKGGDWVLESATGGIEASSLVVLGYGGVLAGESIEDTLDDGIRAVPEDTPTAITDLQVKGDASAVVEVTIRADGGTVSLEAHGSLGISENDGVITVSGTVAEINAALAAGKLLFSPDADQNDSVSGYSASITLAVTGGGSTLVNLAVTAVNDAPEVTGNTSLTIGEKGELQFDPVDIVGQGFSHDQLGLVDVDNLPVQVIFKLEELPLHGTLLLDGKELAKGSTFSAADIGNLVYKHNGEQVTASITDTLQFTVDDGAGGILPKHNFEVTITPVNDLPSASGGIRVIEGESDVKLFENSNLPTIGSPRGGISISDPDQASGVAHQIKVTSLPALGKLYYNGVEITDVSGGFVVDDPALLTYSHNGDEPSLTSYADSFNVVVIDDGGGTGVPGESAEQTIELNILDNNDDPVMENNIAQDLTANDSNNKGFTITEDMLLVTDSDSFVTSIAYTLTSVPDPMHGYLTLNGERLERLVVGSVFTQDDINEDRLAYVRHAFSPGEPGDPPRMDAFQFTVKDGGIRLHPDGREGGIYDSEAVDAPLTVHTFTVSVPRISGEPATEVDPAPVAEQPLISGDKKFLLNEAGEYILTKDDLWADDGVTPKSGLTIRLMSLPSNGDFFVQDEDDQWIRVEMYGSFSVDDIDKGRVKFVHEGNEDFVADVQFSVSNGRLETAADTLYISVTPQNDTPTADAGERIFLAEGDTIAITDDHIILSDRDAVADSNGAGVNHDPITDKQYARDNALSFTLHKDDLPQHGNLYLNGQKIEVVAGELRVNGVAVGADFITVTQAQLDGGAFTYEHDGTENFADQFWVTPVDDADVGATDGTNQTSTGEKLKLDIIISPLNDAPQFESKYQLIKGEAGAIFEGGSAVIGGQGAASNDARLYYSDSDNSPIQRQYRITTAPVSGTLYLGNVALGKDSVFTQEDLDEGRIRYVHKGGEPDSATRDFFEYVVSDGDYSANDTQSFAQNDTPTASRFEIEIQPTNDKPTVTVPSDPQRPGTTDGVNRISGISVADRDLTDNVDPDEEDFIQVTLRVKDSDGDVVSGHIWGIGTPGANSSNEKWHVKNDEGGNGLLVLQGTRQQVNDALAGLSITFADDDNARFTLEVIADDRLRNASGDLVGGANGGGMNQGTTAGAQPVDIANTVHDWTSATVNPNDRNIAADTVEIWSSKDNEGPGLTVPGSQDVLEDIPTRIDTGFVVSDAESGAFDTPVTLTIRVPQDHGRLNIGRDGSSASLTPSGGQPVTISGQGTRELTLTGRAEDIEALLNAEGNSNGLWYTTPSDVNHDLNGAGADGDVTISYTLTEGDSAVGQGTHVAPTGETHLTIGAVNDAPTVEAGTGRQVLGTSGAAEIGGFKVGDKDIRGDQSGNADTDLDLNSGEADFIEATVRLLKQDGTALLSAEYKDADGNPLVVFDTNAEAHGATVVGGDGSALVIRGTLDEVNAYLERLTVHITGDLANQDEPYIVQVIADDRLRDNGGTLTGGANGGLNANSGNTGTAAVSTAAVDPYVTAIPAGLSQNVAVAQRQVFPSALNDPATIEGSITSGVENNNGRVTLQGLEIKDSDALDSNLTVTVTLPDDFRIHSVGGSGGSVATGENTVTITGTLAQINSRLNAIQITLPDLDGAPDGADWNGSFNVTVVVDDLGNNGSRIAALPANDPGNGVTYAYHDSDPDSTDARLITTRELTFTVNPLNDAPVVNGGSGQTIAFGEIVEDVPTGSNPGKTVDELFGSKFNDDKDQIEHAADNGNDDGSVRDEFYGIAITGLDDDAAQGHWQYWDADANDWANIGERSESNALVLAKDTQIRFQPRGDFYGTPNTLTVRLVETDSNNDSATADPAHKGVVNLSAASAKGGTTVYSADTIDLKISVTGVNDAPTLTGDATLPTVEDSTGDAGRSAADIASQLTYSDATDDQRAITGGGNAASGLSAIAITGNTASATTEGVWQYTLNGGDTWAEVPTDVANNKAIVLQTGNDDHKLRFVPVENFNGEPGGLTVRGADSTLSGTPSGEQDISTAIGGVHSWSADSGTVAVTVAPRNDAPTLTVDGVTSGIEVTATESGSLTGSGNAYEVLLLENVAVGDLDLSSTDVLESDIFGAGSITVNLGSDRITGDLLTVDSSLAGIYSVVAYDPASGNLVINLTNDATIVQVQTVLEAVRYAHQSDDPTNKLSGTERDGLTFIVTLNDGNNAQAGGNAGGPGGLDTTVTGRISITAVNDPPVATNDNNTISENATAPVTGDVITGTSSAGTNSTADSDPDTPVADLRVTNIVGEEGSKPVADGSGTVIEGKHGTLTIEADGSYSYVPHPGLEVVDGDTLTDEFTYTLSDGADSDTAKLIITIDGVDNDVTVNVPNDTTAISPDGDVTDHVVFESGLSDGSSPDADDITVDSSFTVKALDGLDSVTIGYTDSNGDLQTRVLSKAEVEALGTANQAVTTQFGTLVLDGYTREADGTLTIDYTYTLTSAPEVTGDDTRDSFTISATDRDDDSDGPVTLNIKIVDDAPVAENDAATVDNATNTVTSNALTGTVTGVGADSKGADDAAITAIGSNGVPGNSATDNGTTLTIEGEHGTLVIDKSTGVFTYTRSNGDPFSATDAFTYTLTDGDGDFDTATITITIDDKEPVVTDGSGNPPTTEPVDPADPTGTSRQVVKPDGSVNEAGLPAGSNPGNGNTTTGTITFTPGDGSHTVTVKGIEVTGIVGQKITTPRGEVTITEYDPANGKIGYEYELKTPTSGDDTTDEFEVVITDADGDDTSVTVVIDIVDDVPQAVDDAFSTREDVPVSGSLTGNDVPSADGGNVWALETPPGNGSVTINPDGTFTYTPRQGFYGSDSFTYIITDADGSTSSATVVIEVVANDPPQLPPVNPIVPPEPGVPSIATPSGPDSPAPWKRAQVQDPSVFFYGDMRYPITNLPLPMHPGLFVNNEVSLAQEEREASDLRATSNPAMGMPAYMQLTSRTLGLGFVPDQFVLSEVNNSQALSQRLASLIESRYQRLSLGGDGLLGTPELSQPDPDMLLSPLAEPQGDATGASGQTSLPRSAPSFTEQLRGGGIRLPLAARETLESRS